MVARDVLSLSLYVTEQIMVFDRSVFDRSVFDGWYFTPGDLQVNYKGVFMGNAFAR